MCYFDFGFPFRRFCVCGGDAMREDGGSRPAVRHTGQTLKTFKMKDTVNGFFGLVFHQR